ncbi:hypothetical protein AK812_SmicGene7946 [Symbiodinium microadriaticum]|uniref:Uncharacterized protein n=1 Tax=Symbiodinium microadriaticum TaxID=2951 RepID=A0A1Q9EM48_SYMMI|nr:hypothetical protein AK812_SmicGene7946 [Symbiodinium microadriaticum]
MQVPSSSCPAGGVTSAEVRTLLTSKQPQLVNLGRPSLPADGKEPAGDYVARTGIREHLLSAVRAVTLEQPKDPIPFLARYLQACGRGVPRTDALMSGYHDLACAMSVAGWKQEANELYHLGLLRAAKGLHVLACFGRVWAPSDNDDDNDDAYANTQKVRHVDVFVSHSWSADPWAKHLAMCFFLNFRLAVKALLQHSLHHNAWWCWYLTFLSNFCFWH